MIGRLRPQDKSAKNWSPDPIGAAVITFEWIVQGVYCKEFLGRAVAFDHCAGKPVVVPAAWAHRSNRLD